MPGVFISYRRQDSAGYTGRLFDILSARIRRDHIFMDLDSLEGGQRFSAVIDEKIQVSEVVLAVIGPQWVTPRLLEPDDFVRQEISHALAKNVRVIPVLVGGAQMPLPADLPDDLRGLTERQAIEVRDSDFHIDAEQLAAVVMRALPRSAVRRSPVRTAILVGSILLAVVALVFVFRWTANAVSVAGTWTATVTYDWGDTHPETFDFAQEGKTLSGTATFLRTRRGIRDGTLNSDRIRFFTTSETRTGDESSLEKHFYEGRLEGDTIRFTMVTETTSSSRPPITFVAQRSPG